jgi:hypothetical protein
MAWSPTLGFVTRPRQLGRILCSHDPTAVFRSDVGTSYAAPFVARIASAVLAENPSIERAALIRALVLQSAAPVKVSKHRLPDGTAGQLQRYALDLVGHGLPRLQEAIGSSRDRVVLVAEGLLPVDFVIMYEVPLPASFFASGGIRRITLSVCFDPLTRYKRLDYLGSRLYPYMFHGGDPDAIASALIDADEDALGGSLGDLEDFRLKLQPSATVSSESANILTRWKRSTLMSRDRGDTAYLAIKSTGRWAPDGTSDPFGIAVALEHEGVNVDLHAELTARIRIPVEVSLRA